MQQTLRDLLSQNLGRFETLCLFYRLKNKQGFGLFSCMAGETFPGGWLKAIEEGVWEEKGLYGDNFREAFNLKQQDEH